MAQTTTERTASYRERQRARGLRPVTMWMPDLRDPLVRAELSRRCAEIAAREEENRDLQAFFDAMERDMADMLNAEESAAR